MQDSKSIVQKLVVFLNSSTEHLEIDILKNHLQEHAHKIKCLAISLPQYGLELLKTPRHR